MVPVDFLRNFYGDGFLSPFRWPKVLVFPYWLWAWRPISNSPPKLATCNYGKNDTPGLEVVKFPNVEPVGGMLDGYLER